MIFRELHYTREHLQLLDAYQSGLSSAQFMQSSQWAAFQQARGNRLALIADEKKGIIFLALRQPLGNRSYWYIPRFDIPDGIEELFREIDPGTIFIRSDIIRREAGDSASFARTIDVQPSRTLLLNLALSEDELLAQMHQKTRYNIRLAEKKNLSIKTSPEHAEEFLELLEETRQRDGFRLHGKEYYRAMIRSGAVELKTVWQGEKLLAGSLMAAFGDTVTYVHGASSSSARQLMAPYALQWDSIKKAKAAGYRWYDWHGIDEQKWPGVTRFKLGFGGQPIQYAGTFDRPLAPFSYAGYTVLRRLRRLFS